MRKMLIACAAVLASAAVSPAMAEDAPARCEAQAVRVYFAPGSTTLDSAATDMLRVAQSHMADCTHAELSVRTDASAVSQERGRAVLAAMQGRAWDVAQTAPTMTQRVSVGPAFVDVVMTPDRLPAVEMPHDDTGV